MKKILSVLILATTLALSGCSGTNMFSDWIFGFFSDDKYSSSEYVQTIQNAEMIDSEYTYKETFDNFFADPEWTHFTSDDGDEVVEFTGECMYNGESVDVVIQFVITDETDDFLEWEEYFLSFDGEPQSDRMMRTLMETVEEEYILSGGQNGKIGKAGQYDIEDDDYLFPSDVRLISEYDLDGLSKSQVALIRNEIYARHGYIFQTEEYADYFSEKDWYVPNPYFDESDFNDIEMYNKDFIVDYEAKRGWR